MKKKIKVLIVEDSLVGQKLLKGLIESDQRFELLPIAENGKQALTFVKKYLPDVVSMDINMPVMNGVEATRSIMQEHPVPVVIVSSLYNSSEVEMAMNVLQAGAVNILPRPFGPGHPKFSTTARQYLNTLMLMSEVKVVRRKATYVEKHEFTYEPASTRQIFTQKIHNQIFQILAIGASAGGPEGISTILKNIPKEFPIPVLIVQHIDANFADGFRTWLNTFSNLPVHTAAENMIILPGNAYIPPGGMHMSLKTKTTLHVSEEPKNLISKPSINVLFKSLNEVYGKNTLAVLLSGMGKDGAEELKLLHDSGAYTLVQDEESCLVFGMPGEAIKLNSATFVGSPQKISKEICSILKI